VEEPLGFGDGRLSDRQHPFKDFQDGFNEDNDAKGGGGGVGGLAGLVQDYPVGVFQGLGMVAESHQWGEDFEHDCGVDEGNLFPHGVWDPIGTRS